jgi:hypothetical protein
MPSEQNTFTRRDTIKMAVAGLPAIPHVQTKPSNAEINPSSLLLNESEVPDRYDEISATVEGSELLRSLRESDLKTADCNVANRFYARRVRDEVVSGIGHVVILCDDYSPQPRTVQELVRGCYSGFAESVYSSLRSETSVSTGADWIEWDVTLRELPRNRPKLYRDTTRIQVVDRAISAAIAYGPVTHDSDPRKTARSHSMMMKRRLLSRVDSE